MDLNDAIALSIAKATAALLRPTFVPGTGAVYIKAVSGVISCSGCWM